MTATTAPLVTIGMPVFNEGAFIGASLTSLLAQDHENLEIVVSDNASTDDTGDVVRSMAASDPRVIYECLEANIGAAANFRRVASMGKGEFFMWAAGHDLWSPNLLSACLDQLGRHAEAVLASAGCHWIDENAQPVERWSGQTDTRGMGPAQRFNTVFWGNMHPILGVLRRSAMTSVQPLKDCVGADLIYLAELSLRGDFLFAPGATWCRRSNRAPESHTERMRRYTSTEYGLTRTAMDRFAPLLRLPWELLKVVARSRLPAAERAALMLGLLASFPTRYLAGRG